MAFKYTTITLPVPLGGLNTKDEPSTMRREFSPNLHNVEIDRLLVKKRLGYAELGTNLPLTGTGMELAQYTDGQGADHLIALTTRHAYKYNSGNDLWDNISVSTLLEDCEDVWVAGSGDTIATETTIKRVGTKSVKITLVAERSDGNKLAYENISSTDITAHTHIGFWIRSDADLASGALEVIVGEDADGAKTSTHSVSATSSAMTADTWHFFSITETLTNFNAVVSVGLYANTTIASGVILYIDDVRAYTEFTGTDTDRWSHTIANNLTQFPDNGGTALTISNGKDGVFEFQGQSGDIFASLAMSSDFTSFQYANEIADFWNHLFLLNYQDSATIYVRNLAWHAVSSDTYANLSLTENVLTDSRGQLRRAKKLGYDMVVYSDKSITICRRVGGTTLFVLPTVIYESGLFSEKAIWDSVNTHYFLGTDQKIYAYTGGTILYPIGLFIEDSLFNNVDPSKKEYIVTGLNPVKHKVYWFYPKTSDTYAQNYYVYNYDKQPLSWEQGRLANTVADFSIFNNLITWACDGPQVAGKACNAAEFATMACDDGAALGGYPQTVFLSKDSYVFAFTGAASSDSGTDIEAWIETPDLVPASGRTDEEARWGGYNFSAKADLASSTLQLAYSTDGGDNWTTFDTITLTGSWVQYRNPIDVKSKKMRFRVYQNSSGDFKIRSQSYKVQIATDK